VGTVRERIRVDVAHVHTVNIEVTNSQLANNLCTTILHVHNNTVLCQDNSVAVNTRGNGQFLIGTQVTPLAVNRHSVLWSSCIVKEQQLAAIAVAGSVHLSFLIGNNLSADLRQHIHYAVDSFFITWNQGGREDNHIAVTNGDLTVLTSCHTRQCCHGLALSTCGNQDHLVRSHHCCVFNGNDGSARNLQKAHLLGDFHIAQHGTTVEGHLAASLYCGIDSSLNAVNVGCE